MMGSWNISEHLVSPELYLYLFLVFCDRITSPTVIIEMNKTSLTAGTKTTVPSLPADKKYAFHQSIPS